MTTTSGLRRLSRGLLAAALVGTGLLTGAGPASAADAAAARTLHFKVQVGQRWCDVVGDLYVPVGATAQAPAPAILTTNGFGGSKDDQRNVADAFTRRGYVVLSYSGLGFGGSGCPISDDDPDTDGRAASQLVGFLGGQKGVAYEGFDKATGWTSPVTLDVVAHDGAPAAHDPRVGMIGGSYGGQVQFAAASVDKRIDTLIPLITWHDLAYSLTPGNGGTTAGSLQAGLPGVVKREWDDFFFGLGATAFPRQQLGTQGTPTPADLMCPGFQPETCRAQAAATRDGYGDAVAYRFFHHSSVASYLDRIKVPVLLAQGEGDSLFDLQEATASYLQLRGRRVPVKMMWQSWGHSRIGPATGEYVNTLDPSDTTPLLSTYQGKVFGAWFDHYLKGKGPAPSNDFSYFRPWALTGSGPAAVAAAYGHAPSFPTGTSRRLLLSGSDALVTPGAKVSGGAASLTTPVGAPASYSETSVAAIASSYGDPDPQPAPFDPPGTAASWTSAPLAADTDVAGIPSVDLRLSAPAVASQQRASDPATHLVLFAKVYDVGPGGAVVLPERLVSPVRVRDVAEPLHVQLPGIVHRFAKGHRVRLVVAGSDSAYAGNTQPFAVSFPTSAARPGVLTLPVVSGALRTEGVPGVGSGSSADAGSAVGTAPRAAPAGRSLASTGLPVGLPVAAAVLLLGAAVLVRRRRGAAPRSAA